MVFCGCPARQQYIYACPAVNLLPVDLDVYHDGQCALVPERSRPDSKERNQDCKLLVSILHNSSAKKMCKKVK